MKVQIPGQGWCMGISEIAHALGISRQTAHAWHARGKLPEPDAKLAMGPVWKVTTIAKAFPEAFEN